MAIDIERLREKRGNYGETCEQERFHLDAYAGTGGFSGRVRASASSYWGWAADVYAPTLPGVRDGAGEPFTYLDRFDREDAPKFAQRSKVVHYENHVETCVDIPLSYLRRKALPREGVSEAMASWMTDPLGDGTSWDTFLLGDVLLRGTVTGLCAVLFDLDPANVSATGMRTRADDVAEGRRVRAVPLFAANILDYQKGRDGRLEWAKVAFEYCDRAGPLDEAVERTEIRIIDAETITVHRFAKRKGGSGDGYEGAEVFANPFGEVPIVPFRPRPAPGDPLLGISPVKAIAEENRRLFNLHSELDEHIRKSVFSFLQVPIKSGAAAAAGPLIAGSGSALAIDQESRQGYAWISPGQDVAQVLEARIANTKDAIYAIARLSFVRGQIVSAAQSGLSRAYEFESTNRGVVDIAQKLAEFDQRALRLVSIVESPADVDTIRTTAPRSFDIEDIDKELATAEAASRGRFGAEAMTLIRQRAVRLILPNIEAETQTEIDAQIEALAETEAMSQAQSDAMAGMDAGLPIGPTLDGEGNAIEGVEAGVTATDAVDGATVINPSLAKSPGAALNGAQIASLLGIVKSVASGELDKGAGVAMILAAFPLTEQQAKAILDPIRVRAQGESIGAGG